MTREEAIKVLSNIIKSYKTFPKMLCKIPHAEERKNEYVDALKVAIEALQEPKTIIGIDIPYGSDKGIATLFKGKNEKMVLENVKEIMAVVRCKDCIYLQKSVLDRYYCLRPEACVTPKPDGFCNYGKRKEVRENG